MHFRRPADRPQRPQPSSSFLTRRRRAARVGCTAVALLLIAGVLLSLWIVISPIYAAEWGNSENLLYGAHRLGVGMLQVAPLTCRVAMTSQPPHNNLNVKLHNRLNVSMNRFRHVSPNRTLLKLLSEARGPGIKRSIEALAAAPPVQVRFLTVTTAVDAFTAASVAGAAVSGVRLEILGVGWKDFSFPGRFALLLSYIEKEGLKDSDVVMLMDNDAMFVGLDPYLAIQSFVTLSPAAREDLAGCARDIRLGWRMAPIRFTAENYCMRRQVSNASYCRRDYEHVRGVTDTWTWMGGEAHAFVSRDVSMTPTNPFRYLNTGVMVARVWALRTYIPLLRKYMTAHLPFSGGSAWTSDQSVTSTLYLFLRWWEVAAVALEGVPPRNMSLEALRESGLQGHPDDAPTTDHAPYGLPAGLIDVDAYNRIATVISKHSQRAGLLQLFGGSIDRSHTKQLPSFASMLEGTAKMDWSMTPVGTPRSNHVLTLRQRREVDCGTKSLRKLSNRPRCAFVAASLGQAPGDAVVPLVWHFAGPVKRADFPHFLAWTPWMAVLTLNATARNESRQLLETISSPVWHASGGFAPSGTSLPVASLAEMTATLQCADKPDSEKMASGSDSIEGEGRRSP